jgi:DNA excision repair protein ERCC-4
MRIIIDEREKYSKVPAYLKEKRVYIEFKLLDVGDYLISECIIERKTTNDFISSLFSGRLFDQAYRMNESYKFKVMIIEGDFQESVLRLQNPKILLGAFVSITFDYGINLLFTLNEQQTAELIYMIAKKYPFGKKLRPPLVVKKPRIETINDAQLAIVESIPGIGPKLAQRLLQRFGSIRKIFMASAKELALKGGIGEKRARKISEVLDFEYKSNKIEPFQSKLNSLGNN